MWSGPQDGHGRLRRRSAQLAVRRGSAPATRVPVWFPHEDAPLVAGRAGEDAPLRRAVPG